jgi:hypothetical protein
VVTKRSRSRLSRSLVAAPLDSAKHSLLQALIQAAGVNYSRGLCYVYHTLPSNSSIHTHTHTHTPSYTRPPTSRRRRRRPVSPWISTPTAFATRVQIHPSYPNETPTFTSTAAPAVNRAPNGTGIKSRMSATGRGGPKSHPCIECRQQRNAANQQAYFNVTLSGCF